MSEVELGQWVLGGGIATGLVRAAYVWWFKSRADVQQAGANADLYQMLREDMRLLRKEMRLMKRQLVILERLATQSGIDVDAAYKEAGIYDDDADL